MDARESRLWLVLTLAAVPVGLTLMIDSARASSATYDEVAYLRIAAHWWRTGEQETITRMGSPLTFWKIQQAPMLWALDRSGRGAMIDDSERHQAPLLPLAHMGSLWIWAVALLLCAGWARRLFGQRTMAATAWLFALEPNLLAHGSLITMEMPLTACAIGMFWLFDTFLRCRDWRAFWACTALGGLAFSCKFTAIVLPVTLALAWFFEAWRRARIWQDWQRTCIRMVSMRLRDDRVSVRDALG